MSISQEYSNQEDFTTYTPFRFPIPSEWTLQPTTLSQEAQETQENTKSQEEINENTMDMTRERTMKIITPTSRTSQLPHSINRITYPKTSTKQESSVHSVYDFMKHEIEYSGSSTMLPPISLTSLPSLFVQDYFSELEE